MRVLKYKTRKNKGGSPKILTRRHTVKLKTPGKSRDLYDFFTYTSHYVGFSKIPHDNNYYYITPFQLNPVVLQYLINNNKIKLVKIPDGRYMLTLIDFPSLILEKNKYQKKTQYESGKFVPVYELNNENENLRILSLEENMHNLLSTNSKFKIPAYLESNNKEVFIVQNIDYIKDLINTLKQILNGQPILDNQCDLNNELSEFNIIDIMNDVPNVGKVIIVGYPNSQTMSQYLNHTELTKYMVDESQDNESLLFELCNLLLIKEGKNPLDTINDLLSGTFFDKSISSMKKILRDYFDDLYSAKFRLIIKKIKEKRDQYTKKIFGRKDFRISYIFNFFAEYTDSNGVIQYRPMIFNLRELGKQYLPVLERTNTLIETKIPEIFGILKKGEKKYENFYSYYTYSDLFHIKTEFVNYSGGSFSLYFNEYQRSITLDELIHSLTIKSYDFWKKVKLYYTIRNFKLEKTDETSVHNQSYNNNHNHNKNHNHNNNNHKNHNHNSNNHNSNKNNGNFKTVSLRRTRHKFTHKKVENLFDKKTTIIKCIMNPARGLSVYFKRDGKFYYIHLLPRLRGINYNKLDLNNQGNIIFRCGEHNSLSYIYCSDAVYYSSNEPIILNYAGKDLIKSKSLNLFTSNWNFGLSRQKVQNYNFIDKLIDSIKANNTNTNTNTTNNKSIKFSNYFRYALYNLFLVSRQEDELKSSSLYDLELDERICNTNSEEDIKALNSIWYFEKIKLEVNGVKYLLLVQKVIKYESDKSFKYVVWVYQTNDDYTLNINGNKLRNIYDINDFNTLNTIINKIKESKKLFPDSITNYKNFPNPENIYVHKAVGYEGEVLHFHIFTNEVIDNYYSLLYGKAMTLGTENRLLNIKNALSLLKVYDGYFKDMKDEDSKQHIFYLYLYSSI